MLTLTGRFEEASDPWCSDFDSLVLYSKEMKGVNAGLIFYTHVEISVLLLAIIP